MEMKKKDFAIGLHWIIERQLIFVYKNTNILKTYKQTQENHSNVKVSVWMEKQG